MNMETSFITPIQPWSSISTDNGIQGAGSGENVQNTMFRDIFENAVSDVEKTEKNLTQQQYLLASGQVDDPHTVQIAASEAQLSTNMLVQLRNKTLDAYNELMRISL